MNGSKLPKAAVRTVFAIGGDSMANEEHIKILKQGVDTWNQWRRENDEIKPGLSRADLTTADLSRADLSRADLSRAVLSRADLSGVLLSGALLRGADLTHANLTHANLRGADLTTAYLRGADLTHANLRGADLTGASVAWTRLGNIDLSKVKGLDTVTHDGPSTIGIDTVYRSGGEIPEVFLRGAGLPDEFITNMKSLVGKAIEFYSCFISYSSNDDEFARRVHADLQDNGVRCWFAPEHMKIGDKIRLTIDESIRFYEKLLLILSEPSINSSWVEYEVETALGKEIEQRRTMLFPVRLDDAIMDAKAGWAAKIRRERYIGDFKEWKNPDAYQNAFNRLLRDLKAEQKT
jgi:hypothetical protein